MGLAAALTAAITSILPEALAFAAPEIAGGLLGAGGGALFSGITGGDPLTGALAGGITGGLIPAGGELLGGTLGATGGDIAGGIAGGALGAGVTGGNPLVGGLEGGLSGGAAGLLGSATGANAPAATTAGTGSGLAGASAGGGSAPLSSFDVPDAATISGGATGAGGGGFLGPTSIDPAGGAGGGFLGPTSIDPAGGAGGGLSGAGLSTTGNVGGSGGFLGPLSVDPAGGAGGSSSLGGAGAGGGGGAGLSADQLAATLSGGATGFSPTPLSSANIAGGAGAGGGGILDSISNFTSAHPIATLGAGLVGSQLLSPALGSLTGANKLTPAEQALLNAQQPGINAANQLTGSLASGTLPPGAEQSVQQALSADIANIKSRYAAMGMSGSSAEQQDIANANSQAAAQKFSLAQQATATGLQALGLNDNVYQTLVKDQLAKQTGLSQSLGGFFNALGTGSALSGALKSTA